MGKHRATATGEGEALLARSHGPAKAKAGQAGSWVSLAAGDPAERQEAI